MSKKKDRLRTTFLEYHKTLKKYVNPNHKSVKEIIDLLSSSEIDLQISEDGKGITYQTKGLFLTKRVKTDFKQFLKSLAKKKKSVVLDKIKRTKDIENLSEMMKSLSLEEMHHINELGDMLTCLLDNDLVHFSVSLSKDKKLIEKAYEVIDSCMSSPSKREDVAKFYSDNTHPFSVLIVKYFNTIVSRRVIFHTNDGLKYSRKYVNEHNKNYVDSVASILDRFMMRENNIKKTSKTTFMSMSLNDHGVEESFFPYFDDYTDMICIRDKVIFCILENNLATYLKEKYPDATLHSLTNIDTVTSHWYEHHSCDCCDKNILNIKSLAIDEDEGFYHETCGDHYTGKQKDNNKFKKMFSDIDTFFGG